MSFICRYEINIEQIYSITSDNGRNMVKCGSLLQVVNENKESTNVLDFDPDDDEGDNIDVTCDTIFDDPQFDDCMTSHFSKYK